MIRDNCDFWHRTWKTAVKKQKSDQVNWLYLALFNDSEIRQHPIWQEKGASGALKQNEAFAQKEGGVRKLLTKEKKWFQAGHILLEGG